MNYSGSDSDPTVDELNEIEKINNFMSIKIAKEIGILPKDFKIDKNNQNNKKVE